jgi:hypothetical protein
MIDKYRELTIFEVENGWVLKAEHLGNQKNNEPDSYTSTFYPNNKSLLEGIKEEIK